MDDKNINLEIYNQAYNRFTPDYIQKNLASVMGELTGSAQSVITFLKSYYSENGGISSLNNKNVLELGCGLGGVSHFLSDHCAGVVGVDISSLAVVAAKELAQLSNIDLRFSQHDVCSSETLPDRFDLIVDSHLLHCITGNKDRVKYFEFVKKHLNPGGIFLCETMAFSNEIQEPLGYELTQDNILLKEINSKMLPIRAIHHSIDLESELIENGFSINYFFFHNELSIDVFPEFNHYPNFRLPKLVRLSARPL